VSVPGIRELFLETSRVARGLVARPEIAERWDQPSALREFSIRGLSGHLYRATGSVSAYLDRGEPEGGSIDAAAYYAEAVGEPDVDSDLHRAVRQRGEEAAAGGRDALLRAWDDMIEGLTARLQAEPRDRRLSVFKGLVLTLDDYLITRLVELVVHADDLAVSIDIEPPELAREAYSVAIDCLVNVARIKHGDGAIIRALTRRERDVVQALRVL
jgi:uncharacterized protein (TIGR03083 family)